MEDCPTRQQKAYLIEELVALFSQFGEITEILLPMKNKQDNKGYAFVSFGSPEEVVAIFENRHILTIRAKPVV